MICYRILFGVLLKVFLYLVVNNFHLEPFLALLVHLLVIQFFLMNFLVLKRRYLFLVSFNHRWTESLDQVLGINRFTLWRLRGWSFLDASLNFEILFVIINSMVPSPYWWLSSLDVFETATDLIEEWPRCIYDIRISRRLLQVLRRTREHDVCAYFKACHTAGAKFISRVSC